MIIGQLALEIVALWMALRSRSRVLAVVLAYALVDELVIGLLHWRVFYAEEHPLRVAMATIGYWPARSLYHLETALVLGWPAVLAGAACLRNFASSEQYRMLARPFRPGPGSVFFVGGLWALAVVALVAAFPLPKGWTAPTLHALSGLFVAAAVVALGVGFRRRVLRGTEVAALGWLVAVELSVVTVGAWGHDVFTDWETLARIPHSMGLLAVIATLAYSERR